MEYSVRRETWRSKRALVRIEVEEEREETFVARLTFKGSRQVKVQIRLNIYGRVQPVLERSLAHLLQ